MAVSLDLADIQGNILTAYGKLGFPKGRFMLFHVDSADSGRKFVTGLLPMITTALRWPSTRKTIPTGQKEVERPDVTVNIAFTWYGLLALGIPTRTLRGMPDEFIDGMARRAAMLGDDFKGQDFKESWDEVWINSGSDRGTHPDTVHILIMLNAQMHPDGSAVAALETITAEIEGLRLKTGGVQLLAGHNRKGQPPRQYQELSALLKFDSSGKATVLPKEHFGFTDALGDPVFDGQYPEGFEQSFKVGNGAVDGKGSWRPLKTGEFLLGYPNEAQETALTAMPLAFSRNGTFMAYRKLHQNVKSFREFINIQGQRFGAAFSIDDPSYAREALVAKMAGRWSDGVPVTLAPTPKQWDEFNAQYPPADPAKDPQGWAARNATLINFTFADDPEGIKCPLTAHIRRVNTRDMMAPTGTEGSILNNRRRILRRGLPYGESPDGTTDEDEHGIVMLAVCASLFRQFEFVQQQWINYGLDAHAGSDTCPIVGNHSDGMPGGKNGPKAKYVIPADPASGHPPFIAEGIPQFVETRGGEYFFVPSMTALRMISMGVVDPT